MDYLGKKYELVSSENFEDYLAFIGVGYIQRKLAVNLKPVQSLTRNDDGTYSFSFDSTLVSMTLTFTPGVEFEDSKPKLSVKFMAIITLEDNKMIHIQKEENGRIIKHDHEFFPDKMIITTTADGFDKIAKRYFVSVK